jgi:hypothetical protein
VYSAAIREFDVTADKPSATFENIFRAKRNARRQAGQSGHCVVLVLIATRNFKGICDVYFVTKYGVIRVLRSAAWPPQTLLRAPGKRTPSGHFAVVRCEAS